MRCAPGWPARTGSAARPGGSPSGPRSAPSRSACPGRCPTTCWLRPGRRGRRGRSPRSCPACLPVLVLAMGTTLAHMLRADAGPGHGTRGPAAGRAPARSCEDQAGPSPDQTASAGTPAGTGPPARTAAVPRQDHRPGPRTSAPGQTETGQVRLIASRLAAAGKPVSRRALRSRGIRGSNAALNALAREINAELADTSRAAPGLDAMPLSLS